MACPKEHVGTSGEGTGTGGTSTGSGTTDEPTPTTGAGPTSAGDGTSTGSTGAVTTTGLTGMTGPAGSSEGSGGVHSTGEDGTGRLTDASHGDASSGDASSGDVSTGDASTGEPGQLFDCFGCTCDALTSFCRKVFAGFAGPDRSMCPIVEAEGLESGCVVYPRDCDERPSCKCLPKMDGNCFCTQQAPGEFEVTCPLP